MIIYLVIGSRGKYSDHSEWPIKAFTDKEQAVKFVDAFPSLLKNVEDYYEQSNEWYKQQCVEKGAWNNPTIPNWSAVRGALWNEKSNKEIEVEKQYLGNYLGPLDPKNAPDLQDVPDGVSITEVELV